MGMQSKVSERNTKINDGSTLPFQLHLIEGGGRVQRKIPITKLANSPFQAHLFSYDVEELVDLEIVLSSRAEERVDIVWGMIEEEQENELDFTISLTKETPSHMLYSIEKNIEYPWRNGFYHFEIIYRDITYFGGFHVRPKNVDDSELYHIHQLINETLEGLVVDYLKTTKSYGDFSNIEDSSHWRYIQWYKSVELKLIESLSIIEHNSEHNLVKTYQVENQPKHMDNRSIQWQNTVKGQVYAGVKYLNKRQILHMDSDANRLVKYRVFKIVDKMIEAIQFIDNIKSEKIEQYEVIEMDVKRKEERLEKMKTANPVTERERKRMRNALFGSKLDLRELKEQIERITTWYQQFRQSRKMLCNRMFSPFWLHVKDTLPTRVVLGRQIGYQLFHQIWLESNNLLIEATNKPVHLPIYKPSYILYEYYVLFGTMYALGEIGFRSKYETIHNQLYLSFFEEGLKEGTQIDLEYEQIKLIITYDQEIELSANEAIEKNTNFYSGESSRKPDIRIAQYEMGASGWIYKSSFIIEVKYSPFYNIYNKQGRTRAAEQMSDYWNIMYAYKDEGRVEYQRNTIEHVICAYPGSSSQKIKTHDDFGVYLQFYPNANSDDIYDMIGKQELKNMFSQWLQFDVE